MPLPTPAFQSTIRSQSGDGSSAVLINTVARLGYTEHEWLLTGVTPDRHRLNGNTDESLRGDNALL